MAQKQQLTNISFLWHSGHPNTQNDFQILSTAASPHQNFINIPCFDFSITESYFNPDFYPDILPSCHHYFSLTMRRCKMGKRLRSILGVWGCAPDRGSSRDWIAVITMMGIRATDHYFFIALLIQHIFLEFCPVKTLVPENVTWPTIAFTFLIYKYQCDITKIYKNSRNNLNIQLFMYIWIYLPLRLTLITIYYHPCTESHSVWQPHITVVI